MKKFLAGIVSFALVAGTFASQVNSAAETADAPETGKQYQEEVLKGVRGRDIQMSVDKSGKFSANITFLTDHDGEWSLAKDEEGVKKGAKIVSYSKAGKKSEKKIVPKVRLRDARISQAKYTYTIQAKTGYSFKSLTVYRYRNKDGKLIKKKKISIQKLKKKGDKEGRVFRLMAITDASKNSVDILYYAQTGSGKLVTAGSAVLNLTKGTVKKEASYDFVPWGLDGSYVYGGNEEQKRADTIYIADKKTGKVKYTFKDLPKTEKTGSFYGIAYCRNGKIIYMNGDWVYLADYTDSSLEKIYDMGESSVSKGDIMGVDSIVMADENTFYVEYNSAYDYTISDDPDMTDLTPGHEYYVVRYSLAS